MNLSLLHQKIWFNRNLRNWRKIWENAKILVYNNYFIVFRTIILNTISNTNFYFVSMHILSFNFIKKINKKSKNNFSSSPLESKETNEELKSQLITQKKEYETQIAKMMKSFEAQKRGYEQQLTENAEELKKHHEKLKSIITKHEGEVQEKKKEVNERNDMIEILDSNDIRNLEIIEKI